MLICDGHQIEADDEGERFYDGKKLTLALNIELPIPSTYSREEEQMEVDDEAGPLVEHYYCRLKSRAEEELIRERDLLRDEFARVKKDNLDLQWLLRLS